jgi:hypothetical protein
MATLVPDAVGKKDASHVETTILQEKAKHVARKLDA